MSESSVSKKTNVRWDDNLKLKLANATSKYRGYKQDDKKVKHPMRMETKWEKIRDHLLADSTIDENFKVNPPSTKSLQTSFHRFLKEVLKAAGISEEGANLSGLDESPTEYQQLMINMAQEIDSLKQTKNQLKEKEKKKRFLVLTHENDHLLQQRKIPVEPSLLLPAKKVNPMSMDLNSGSESENENENINDELDDGNSASNDDEISDEESDEEGSMQRGNFVTPRSSKSAGKIANNKFETTSALTSGSDGRKSRTSNSFMNMVIDLTRDDPKIVEAEIADKKLKRGHEIAEHIQRMEMNERKLSLEERQMQLEEKRMANEAKRLELEERRLAVMERENELKRGESSVRKDLPQQQLNK